MNNKKLQAQLDNLETSRAEIVSAIIEKGVSLDASAKLSECPQAIAEINAGGLPLEMCCVTNFNPPSFSTQLEQSGYKDVILDYLAACKCYVFNAAGTKKAEIASAVVEGNYSVLSGIVTFADGTTKTIDELNAAGCNFMVHRPEMNIYVDSLDDGSQMLYFGGRHAIPKLDAITLPAKYIGMYEGYLDGITLKSQPNRLPTYKLTYTNIVPYAQSNGDGFGIMSYTDFRKEVALFISYFGVTDAKSAIGDPTYLSKDSRHITGHSLPLLNGHGMVTFAKDSSNNVSIPLVFGLEEIYSGKYEYIQGIEKRSKTSYVWEENQADRPANYRSITLPAQSLSPAYIKTIKGGKYFDVTFNSYGATESTGWASYVEMIYASSAGALLIGGGFHNKNNYEGIVSQFWDDVKDSTNTGFCARIACFGDPIEVTGAELLN